VELAVVAEVKRSAKIRIKQEVDMITMGRTRVTEQNHCIYGFNGSAVVGGVKHIAISQRKPRSQD
jgi:hypothetical protein